MKFSQEAMKREDIDFDLTSTKTILLPKTLLKEILTAALKEFEFDY